jgi:hypothetical protein
MGNVQVSPQKNFNQRMMVRQAWEQEDPKPMGHCAVYNQIECLLQRCDAKHNVYAHKGKRNRSRIIVQQKPVWQQIEFFMQSSINLKQDDLNNGQNA